MKLGLGTGSTAKHFVDAVGEKVKQGWDLVCVPTSEETRKQAESLGIRLTMKATLTKIERGDEALRVTLSTGEHVEADQVLLAIGRHPNTRGLGLERAGVQLDQYGAVVVDEYSQSSVANIYAIGDVTNRVNLTPVAIRDGHAFADTVYNNRPTPVDHRSVPSAVMVALVDEESRAQSDDIANRLRACGIPTEVAPAPQRFGKQIRTAERRGIPFVWFPGAPGDGDTEERPDQVKDIRS